MIIMIYKIIFTQCVCVCVFVFVFVGPPRKRYIIYCVRIKYTRAGGAGLCGVARGGARPVAAPARPTTTAGRARETRRRRPGVVSAGSNDEFAQRCGHDCCPHVAASRRTRRPVSRVLLAASVRAVPANAQVCPVQKPRCRVRPEGECCCLYTYV